MRASYRPSGKLHLDLLLMWSPFPIGVAILLGALTYLAFRAGILLPLVAGLLVGSLLGGAVWIAVRFSHCRNRVAAAILAVVAVAVYFVAYFQAGIVYQLGQRGITRFDLLPGYVQVRMETDLIAPTALPKKNLRPNPRANWTFFGLEVLLVTGMAVMYSVAAAPRPYCESQETWLKSKMIFCRGDYFGDLRRRMNEGAVVSSLRDLERVTKEEPGDLILILYYCKQVKRADRPVHMYLALSEFQGERDKVMLRGKVWNLPQFELYPKEFAVAGELFDVPVHEVVATS